MLRQTCAGSFRTMVVGLAVFCLPSSGAGAQGKVLADAGEHFIGVIDIAAPDGPDEAQPSADDPDVDETDPPGPSQPELYRQALAQLDQGKTALAQRLFERVIAADPDSELATEARRRLADLYRRAADTPPQGAQGFTSASPSRGTEFEPLPPARPNPARPGPAAGYSPPTPAENSRVPSRQTTTVAVVPPAVTFRFISEVGDRIFFSSGSAELGGRARAVLAAQAKWLVKRPEFGALIEGHADDPPLPSREQQALSEARAEAVRTRLIAEGVEPERLNVVSRGREQRISNCDEPLCGAQNRRAVTVLVMRGPAARSSLEPLDRAPVATQAPPGMTQ